MNINQRGFVNVILIITIVVFVVAIGYFVFTKKSEPVAQLIIPNPPLIIEESITGLHKELENNQGLKSFISNKESLIDKNLLPFRISSNIKLELDANENGHLYFDNLGNPIFFPAEPEYGMKLQGYSLDKRYALEIIESQPDSFVYLWDIKEKKMFQIGSCGTVCGFSGFSWLDSARVAVWGYEANPFEDYNWSKGSAKFITLFDLKNLSAIKYSSQIIYPNFNEKFENAINIKDADILEGLFASNISFGIESTSCCDGLSHKDVADQMLNYIKETKILNFSQEQDIIKKIKAQDSRFKDDIVGIGDNEIVLSYRVNSQNKIEKIYLVKTYKLLISN